MDFPCLGACELRYILQMINASFKSGINYRSLDRIDQILNSLFAIAPKYNNFIGSEGSGITLRASSCIITSHSSFVKADCEIQCNLMRAVLGFLKLPNSYLLFKFKRDCMDHCYNLLRKIYECI
mgnify:FL=1